jgi:hypothetical protein
VAIAVRGVSVLRQNEAQNYGPDCLKFERQVHDNLGQLQDRRELTMAIAVRRAPLDKTLLYLSCARTKLKTVVLSTPARNQAAQRIDETDLFRLQVMIPSKSL